MAATDSSRIPVRKTWKLFIGGAFPRSESGRYLRMTNAEGAFVANISRASRKDARDAVSAARGAARDWAGRTAFLRGQILYRMAETLESRRDSLERSLVDAAGYKPRQAAAEVATAVDRTVWYAGWCDKFAQLFGSTNPVALPYFNFTTPEPCGVVAVIAPRNAPLLGPLSLALPVIAGGNTAVIAVDNAAPSVAIDWAEVLATSDLPGGVVNILTGQRSELLKPLASHVDVDAVFGAGLSDEERRAITLEAAESVKRLLFADDRAPAAWAESDAQSPWWIQPFVEFKTAWHPIGT